MISISFLLLPVVATGSSNSESWVDPQTRLIWATKDSQSGVSRFQAERFCSAAVYGGLHDWRLPTIDELESLAGPPDADGHQLKVPIKITGWEWSATPGQQAGEAWALVTPV